MSGKEETVGGFDLICAGTPVTPSPQSVYKTNLGTLNQREDNMRRLAKQAAQRLAQAEAGRPTK